ncbi:metallophosphoesterase [Marinilabiliaceae bacterium ANBcel2]|nr:metallophosphoesterase [Marinilabiliaceae bacterium ANBcel2]
MILNRILALKKSRESGVATKNNFDIIGDVHGYNKELKLLLKKLGYKKVNGIWQHSNYKAVFVGDFISRGPNSRKVLNIVEKMVKNGTGYAIMGNHELNAIGYFTKIKGKRLNKNLSHSNKKQFAIIEKEFKDDPAGLKRKIKWLRSLPPFFIRDNFRVVHAYWDDECFSIIKKRLNGNNKLLKSDYREIFLDKTLFAKAYWQIVKGADFALNKNLIINKSNKHNGKVKWWELKNRQLQKLYNNKAPIIFFGHYCLTSQSLIADKNICCIDRCIAGNGYLASYRISNSDRILKSDNFTFQKKINQP